MKLVALLIACFLAFASANKCGWKKPSEILTTDSMQFTVLQNPDETGPAGDVLAVDFDFDYNIYQYRIERVTQGGRHIVVDFDNEDYNVKYTSGAPGSVSVKGGSDMHSLIQMGDSVSSTTSKRMLIDAYVAHSDGAHNATVMRKTDHEILDALGDQLSSVGHEGFNNRGKKSEDIDTQYQPAATNIFDTDKTMIVSQTAYMETDVVYIVSVRSLRCGQNFYRPNSDRGILLKGIFRLNIRFDIVVQDHALMGVTSMGMDDEQNAATANLIFVKHVDEFVNDYSRTLNMETFVHDISIAGSISITGDTERECRGESGDGYDDGITESQTNGGSTSTATLDSREAESCQITGTVTAIHHDSTTASNASGTTTSGGDSTEEYNGDSDFVSVDSEQVLSNMQTYRHEHSLADSQIVTFLSLAQFTMQDATPSCTSMLVQGDLDAGRYSPTWFQSPGDNLIASSGTYACANKTTFNRTSWTGGKCAALAANDATCVDVPYIIARHGKTAGHDHKTLYEIGTDIGMTSDREGCTVNADLQAMLNQDNTDFGLAADNYNFTCEYGYYDDAETTCTSGNNCDKHVTTVEYTPFFGFEDDGAYSPLQYTRMWFGRTTDNYLIKTDEADLSNTNNPDNPKTPEFDAVDANTTTGEQDTHSRRLRGVEKVRKLLKAAPPAVNEMYQQTFHFKVRAPPGKLRHRHRHH